MKILLPFLLLGILSAPADCFNLLFSNGLKAYNSRQFATALQKLTAARDCPDRPRSTDLEDWIRRAQQGLDEQRFWNRARNADSPESYRRYLDRYPDGHYRRRAEEFLKKWQTAPATPPVQEILPAGNINWTEEYVEASGQSFINREQYPNEAQAVAMATRGAEVVAKANLLEMAGGVHILRTTTVKDLMTGSDIIETRVQGVVKGARPVGEPRIANGLVTVTLRMPVFGVGGVAEAALPIPRPDEVATEIPDSTGEGPVLRLNNATALLVLYPTLVDESGAILFDGSAFSRSAGSEPLVRYMRPASLPADTRTVSIYEDAQGRWVVPAAAMADLRRWLDVRTSGGGAGRLRVVM
jgi:hypothetical protein